MKIKSTLFLLLISTCFFAQKLINDEALSYSIKDKNNTIEFIVLDKQLSQKKPVLLWCQGSLPYPIYVDSPNEGLWIIGGGITNFDTEYIKKYYHLVIISMPETPLIAQENEINDSYWYFGDSKKKNIPSTDFQKADYLENYVDRGIKVLKFLKKQKWVDSSKLIVAGHSQGSKVASKIAIKYKGVSKLGLFSANPIGRIDQNIRTLRKKAESNVISWEEADKAMNEEYQFYKDSFDSEKVKQNPDLLSWKSFSEPLIFDWLSFNKPIYLAYGTNDIASDLCDLVPLYFIRAKKDNLTYKKYLNMDHNFYEVTEMGNSNQKKEHWREVMNQFVDWTNQ